MLKGNLATRPFYNERLRTVAIVVAAATAVLLTGFNAAELMRLSSERAAALSRIDRDHGEAVRVRAEAERVQKTVDRTLLGRLAQSTREANDLIDQRTFSWTAFFTLIEKTLPIDVRLIQVSPRVEKGEFKVGMTIVARSLSDVATFSDALRGTGAFYDVAAINQQARDDGTYAADLEAAYLPPQTVTDTPAARGVSTP